MSVRALLLFAAAGLVAWRSGLAPAPADERCALAAPAGAAPESLVAEGRYWHALRAAPAPPPGRAWSAREAVLQGLINEGLGRWSRVEDVLRRTRGVDSLPELLALAARADEHAGRWAAAAARYRRLAALPPAAPELRASAQVRLAVALDALGRRDSAAAAWRRAVPAVPDLADWLALRRADDETDTAVAFASISAPRSPGAAQRADLLIARRRLAAGNLQGAIGIFRRYGRALDVARVEYALGARRLARVRADSVLVADETKPTALLAATFLTVHFDTLTVAEYLGVSRAYRARGDLEAAERFARRAIARSDTTVGAWLELSRIETQRGNMRAALVAVDSASGRGTPRAGARVRRRFPATEVALARVLALAAGVEWDEADSLVRMLARRYPRDTSIAHAILVLADHDRATGKAAAERARYGLLVREFAGAPAANAARLRLALQAYARGSLDTAQALIAAALARDTTMQLGLTLRYWDARMRYDRGDSTGIAALHRISAQSLLGYYGVRAREILGDTLGLIRDSAPPPRPGSYSPARARERVRLLARLGFDAEARQEALGWATDTTASVYVLLAAASAAADAGFAREAITLGEAALARGGMLLGVARALFPLPYRQLIEAEAAEQCVDPLLLAAIIRQESRFDPGAISRAGARGMGQVMPYTGRELAARLRLGPWDPALLYVPDFNLHLGAIYIRERIRRDSLPVYALLASYNAGSDRVNRWKTWPEFSDPDLFAERVAIRETNDYVKRVYASYVWYRHAYAASPVRPSADRP